MPPRLPENERETMWLEEFHERYLEAAKWRTGHRLDPSKSEELFAQARELSQINASALEALEQSDAWPHTKWWPELSASFGKPLSIPPNLDKEEPRRNIVEKLNDRLKHIEYVSVILRFFCPKEFGILSFPVSDLINLAQAKNPVDYYMEYLTNLRDFRNHYNSNRLRRVADIDMALWTATHLPVEKEFGSLKEEMYRDEYFQEVRFRNLLKGLRTYWKRTDPQYMVFARAFLQHDCRISSLIVARVYENLIVSIGHALKVKPIQKERQTIPGAFVDVLGEDVRLRQSGIRKGQLADLWNWRNRAVHDEGPLEPSEAKNFLSGTEQLLRIWEGLTEKKSDQ